jgi:hypothetical protein
MAEARRHVVCAAADIAPGERRIVEVAGRRIGVFNVGGRVYALHNGCPHKGGELCAGRITGTVLPTHAFLGAYDNCLHYLALFHLTARNCFLNGYLDDITHGSIAPVGTAKNLDAHDSASAAIVSNI